MAKRIILCFDGTWNTPAEQFSGLRALHARFALLGGGDKDALREALERPDPGGDAVETNVCRLYRSIRRLAPDELGPGSMAQVKWYDAGVGTNWYDRVSGGTFGLGLSQNIRDGYHFLAQTYVPGDEVFILGFSRGAYTARSLVGMLRNCWLLPGDALAEGMDSHAMREAYEIYRTRGDSADSPRAVAFRAATGARQVKVKFLGVWDTVGALGIPLQSFDGFNQGLFQFHDTELSGIVENAYQAVAIDEHRRPYAATLWAPVQKPGQTLEQRWFMGAHCDVGGGYEDRRLSDIPLAWMQGRAEACGLVLHPGAKVQPGPEGALAAKPADSFAAFLKGLFQLFQTRFYRPVGTTSFGREKVDASVAARLAADPSYRPPNPGLLDLASAGGD